MTKSKFRYLIEAPGGPFAFVPHPAATGLWLRTHPVVLVQECEACKAEIGEPCRGPNGPHSITHWVRRRQGKHKLDGLSKPTVIVMAVQQRK